MLVDLRCVPRSRPFTSCVHTCSLIAGYFHGRCTTCGFGRSFTKSARLLKHAVRSETLVPSIHADTRQMHTQVEKRTHTQPPTCVMSARKPGVT